MSLFQSMKTLLQLENNIMFNMKVKTIIWDQTNLTEKTVGFFRLG
jgi:hypothetical protein